MGIAHALHEGRRLDRPAVLQEGRHARRVDRLRFDQQAEDQRVRALDLVRHVRRHHDELARLPGPATDADANGRRARGRHAHAVSAHGALGGRAEQARVEHALRREPHQAFALPCGATRGRRVVLARCMVLVSCNRWTATLRWRLLLAGS
jgi:hypothetical protein